MNKVALIIIFNHRYDGNIPVLEKIYGKRFSNIFYLVPFYDGPNKNVIPVYENSFYFQGYVAQAYKHFSQQDFTHYFFIADDLVLNPCINEDNYASYFNLKENDCFISDFHELHDFKNDKTLCLHSLTYPSGKTKYYWNHTPKAYQFSLSKEGIKTDTLLPTYQDALLQFKKHGVSIKALKHEDIYGAIPNEWEYDARYTLEYPMVAAYSDIFIVSHKTISKFSQLCGIFSVTELFVELAIPTALLLASDNVVTETTINKRAKIYWLYSQDSINQYNTDMQMVDYNIWKLLENFNNDHAYIHPVKLSKWSH